MMAASSHAKAKMMQTIHGCCLCERVQYRITGPFKRFYICHCSQCQRATGSAHASNLFTTEDKLEWIAGKNRVKRFDADQPGTISRCFCTHCGSPVPHRSIKTGKLVVPAGGLGAGLSMPPGVQIFWPDRAKWYDALSQMPRFDAFEKK